VYRHRLSGPLLDRVDIQLRVPRLSKDELLGSASGEPSEASRGRVEAARDRQRRRLSERGLRCNAEMSGALARRVALLTEAAQVALARAVDRFALTGRGFDRGLKVARTIADLAGSDRVDEPHLLEALSYRERGTSSEQAGAA
jgi:magnesium chelatase family protein